MRIISLVFCALMLSASIVLAQQQGPQPAACETELAMFVQYSRLWMVSNVKLEALVTEQQQKITQLTKERDEAIAKGKVSSNQEEKKP